MSARRSPARRFALLVVLASTTAATVTACTPVQLPADRLARVRSTIAAARRDGAYRCAPRELAVAQTNLDFALTEAVQGDPERAEVHLAEAELNARAARSLSPSSRCGDGQRGPALAAARRGEDRDTDGVPDRADLCPDAAEDLDSHLDRDGCPDPDNDDDGVLDGVDGCPDDPEDVDGFEDVDGCPDLDNDADGVADGSDDCPQVAGSAERRGCPLRTYDGIEVTERGFELARPMTFEGRSAKLRPGSAPLLDALAQALQDLPSVAVEIAGHTDSRGDDARNLELSMAQAEAVREALVQRGVPATRLTARGYGETRPIESNRTSQGRAINRRIEILRSDRATEESDDARAGGSDGS